MLGTRGEHQQKLGVGIHFLVTGRQQQFANPLGQRCTAGLAGQHDIQARGAQVLGEVLAIGALARAFGTFQGDKQAAHRQSLQLIIAGRFLRWPAPVAQAQAQAQG
ncbi:hypothetical protein D3C81_1482100 [compost metagenome]